MKEKRTYTRRGQSTVDLSLELDFRKKLQKEISAMVADIEKEAALVWAGKKVFDSEDFPKWFTIELMKRIRQKWYKTFDDLAKELSGLLVKRADARSQKQIMMKLKDYGFTFSYDPTAREKGIISALTAENVQAVKAIPMKLAARAQAAISEAYERGGDMAFLVKRLRRVEEESNVSAELTARDQMNRITQEMAIVNARAAGVRKARWIHVPGMYSSRRTHIAFDRKEFNLEEGLYDSEVGRNVKPGELKYCNCQFRIIAPGFDDED